MQTLPAHGHVRFSPDGRLLANRAYDGTTLTVWDLKEEEARHVIEPAFRWSRNFCFSPDGHTLTYVHDQPHVLRTFDLVRGTAGRSFEFPPMPPLWFPGSRYEWSPAFSPDGEWIAASSGTTHPLAQGPFVFIAFWNLSSGKLTKFYQEEWQYSSLGSLPLAFSPDGKFFAYARGDGSVVMARSPGAGKLQWFREGDRLFLSWPVSAGQRRLERNSRLGPGEDWVQFSETPAVVGDRHILPVPAEDESAFFRLSEP